MSTTGTSTRARATRPAPRSRPASRRSKAPRTASRSRAASRPRTRCCARWCDRGSASCWATTRTAARIGSSRRCTNPPACTWSAVDLTDPVALDASWPDDARARVARDADEPAADLHRHRGGRRRSRTSTARGASSTTRSPRPTCSDRSSTAPTPSCTRRRSTSAATPMWSGGFAAVDDDGDRGADAVHPERGRRGAEPVRLLPRAAWAQDAWPCAWTAIARTRERSSTSSSAIPRSIGCSTHSCPTIRATQPRRSRCATSEEWCRSRARAARRPRSRSCATPSCSRWPSRSARSSRSSSTPAR